MTADRRPAPSLRIAIIGAGFSGLTAAKQLKQFGHEVTVFEKEYDLGGVWSASRRYPGLTTQNTKGTYQFSDFPMPESYPECPRGDQVQDYLWSYADHFGVTPHVRLGAEVLATDLNERAGVWWVKSREGREQDCRMDRFDHLVVANGTFSEPSVPPLAGRAEYERAGGRILAATGFPGLDAVRGRDVIVIGYGKSACDMAVATSRVAASTTVVARELIWKMPRKLGNLVPYQYLFLTRLGEALVPYFERGGVERFLHGLGKPVRDLLLGLVRFVVQRQLGLRDLGLVPDGGFDRIARSTVSLVTDGFYEGVRQAAITVRRNNEVVRLLDRDGRPSAELATGDVVPADVVVCGTGFRQVVPFFDDDLGRRVKDAVGEVSLPPAAEQRRQVARHLRWMRRRTDGKHAHGTNIVPFSMHNIDDLLADLDLEIRPRTRALEWIKPVDPGAYRHAVDTLLDRMGARPGRATRPRRLDTTTLPGRDGG